MYERRGFEPHDFQLRAWAAYGRGESGLIHAPTGTGKTLAAWLGAVIEGIAEGATGTKMVIVKPRCLTPMAFPIWAERLRANALSSESFDAQVRRMVVELETEARGKGMSR